MDLHGVLVELKVTQCVLVGWSQGAQDVAAYLQAFGAGSVLGVVFVDSPVSAGPAEIQIHQEFSRTVIANIALYANHPRQASEGMVRRIFEQPHPDIDMQRLVNFTEQTPVDTGIAMLAADIFGADRRPALAKLNKPALVIASAKSPLLDLEKEMAASIPRAKFVPISGAAHAVFVDQPAKFDDALTAFLRMLNH
jgi:non-heme chloroperoxidase